MVKKEIKACTQGHRGKAVEDRTAVGGFGLVGARNLRGERRPSIVRRIQVDDGRVPAAALITERESVRGLSDVNDLFIHGLLNADRGWRSPAWILQDHGHFIDILEAEGNAQVVDELTRRIEDANGRGIVEARSILVGGATIPIHHKAHAIHPIPEVLIADLTTHNVGGRGHQSQ